MHISDHLKGILITTLGVIILSPDALIIRLLNADTWTVMIWRGTAFAIGITLIMLLTYREKTIQQFIKIGKPGLMIGLFFGCSNLCFTTAIQNTSIANTLVIIATSPMFAALFTWMFLGEKIKTITWVAMLIIFASIFLIMSDSLETGGILGDLSAFGSAIFIAISFTFTRRHKEVNMVPAMALSGILIALVSIPAILSTGGTFKLLPEVVPFLILGGAISSTAFALITLGPRYMPAPEVSLIMPLETVLGTYLGWLFISEKPSSLTIIGGVIIILTLVAHSWVSLKNQH
ncbi:DMT family transporter [uncultured Cocleimonas sp.]|uniref:DMT family transporter n=1 Tax=uncultured Cocleimonas sp. TaxID=1051587 RepID=UPI002603C526|nr:DMT family transporter [uncultured Cocleimonas sp.]